MRWSRLRQWLYGAINTMPNRYVEIPPPVTVLDPTSNQPIPDEKPLDFDFVMTKLMSHPVWGESFAAMRSQDAIHDAWKNAKDGVMVLAEEDWTRLKQAVETPKITAPTGQVIPGFGVHPTVVRQLVPLLNPIVEAKSERPKAKLKAEPAVAADTAS